MGHEGPRVPSLGLGRGFPWLDCGLDISPTSILATSRHANMENLTSLSRRGVLSSLDVRGKESGKWQEGWETQLDVMGNGHPRAAAVVAWRK
ncbi:hypothetical protein CRG98_019185 [Punica granatum]|uniref:Uncharacterized protein n=1 Tax=Punica granatum TaxID=22663 RepID=A0A2I0JVV1_PUNGR|nr:hypothetical protein CRG98_019185 [Punica granatum]